MTYYVCQIPHLRSPVIWTANSEAEIQSRIEDETDQSFASARDAAEYDIRDSYITDDVLDLLFWIEHNEAARDSRARGVFNRDRGIQRDVEALAKLHPLADTDRYIGLVGRFIWDEGEQEWTLGNQPPVAADDLFHALCEASLILNLREGLTHEDY